MIILIMNIPELEVFWLINLLWSSNDDKCILWFGIVNEFLRDLLFIIPKVLLLSGMVVVRSISEKGPFIVLSADAFAKAAAIKAAWFMTDVGVVVVTVVVSDNETMVGWFNVGDVFV